MKYANTNFVSSQKERQSLKEVPLNPRDSTFHDVSKKCLLWYQVLYLSRICASTSGKVANPLLWSNEYITYSRVNLSTYFRTFAFYPLPIKCKKIKVRSFGVSSIGRLCEVQWFPKFIVQNMAGIFHFIKVCHVDSDRTLSLNFAKYKV